MLSNDCYNLNRRNIIELLIMVMLEVMKFCSMLIIFGDIMIVWCG